MNLININESVSSWHDTLFNDDKDNDFLIFYSNDDDYIWFITQYMQFASRDLHGTEIVPIYGKQIKNVKSFLYQINFCLPVGYRMKASMHALYDIVLNFETEPTNRFIFWNDTSYLLYKNRKTFMDILEVLIVAAHVNRNGLGTIKDNGSQYKINQRNFLFFKQENQNDINIITSQKYYVPPYDDYRQISFKTITLFS